MRIDWTNLLGYWDEVTDSPRKRGLKNKRWWGKFKEWLKKMTTVGTGNQGSLPMEFDESFLIYTARKGCSRSTLSAGIDITANAKLSMNAQYACYMSGTLVPPSITDTYAYFGGFMA